MPRPSLLETYPSRRWPLGRFTNHRNWLARRPWQFSGIDPEVLRYGAWVSLWARWLVWLAILIELAYRPETWFPHQWYFLLAHVPLVVCNGLLHCWLVSKRPLTWHWLVALSALDVALVTSGLVMAGEFRTINHLVYYPALALVAVILPSLSFTMVWTTVVAALYTVVSVTQGSGLDMERLDDKALFARVGAMYAVVIIVGLVVRFERRRRQASMEREWEIQRERAEVSRTIHDTVAQSAYMVGLGIYRARKLADESNRELTEALDATAELSKSMILELRRPLDGGQMYEGAGLAAALRSHAETFTTVTSVPVQVTLHGTETELATEVQNRLFSIAHNALTNSFRHAHAGRVEVVLDFRTDCIRLSVSDDGVGLPDDYADRGHGFPGMRADAESIDGVLVVEKPGRCGGTTISCVVPR